MRLNRTVTTAVWLGLAGCIPAFAGFNTISAPVAAYTGATKPIPITPADGTGMTTLTDGTQTITFSSTVYAATVPDGGWFTWGAPPNTESSTPRVLKIGGATALTLTLSVPSQTFGFEIEPNGTSTTGQFYNISAQFYNGGTLLGTVSQSINWQSGALLAAGSDSVPITSVVITAPANAAGFAMAQFRYSTTIVVPSITPAPNTIVTGGLAMLLLAAGALLARARKSAAA